MKDIVKGLFRVVSFFCLSMMVVLSVFIAQEIVGRPSSLAQRPMLAVRETPEEHDARAKRTFEEAEAQRAVKLNFLRQDFTHVD